MQTKNAHDYTYQDDSIWIYGLEDSAFERRVALLKIQRKSNSKRTDTPEQKSDKLKMRKRVETTISDIKKNVNKENTYRNIGRISDKVNVVCVLATVKQSY